MSSRQEEKARRKAEREALERKQAAQSASTRRLQIVGGVVLAIAAIAAIVVVATSGGGGGSGDAKPANAANASVKLPTVKETDLTKAAETAGCKLLNPKSEGRGHTTATVTYKNSNPPASGTHNPVWAEDGIYAPGNEPQKEKWVHALEHGRVEIQYAPGTPKATRDQLESLGSEQLNGSAGYHVLVFENNTKMPYAVAAVAWTHVLGCKTMNDGVFDAVRAFRKAYTDKGPELIP